MPESPFWFDKWQLSAGDSLRDKISSGIQSAGYLAAVLSHSSVTSRWVKEELYAAMARAEEEGRVIVVPLLIEECKIPPLLKDRLYIDFRHDYDSALRQLVERVRTAGKDQVGRTKQGDMLHDWSFDWGLVDDSHRYRLFIVSHSGDAPASFLCRIEVVPNDVLDKRFFEYDEANLPFAPRLLVGFMINAAIKPGFKVVITDEMPAYHSVEFRDPKTGTGCLFDIEVRRMGEALDKAVLYDLGNVISDISRIMGEDVDQRLTENDRKTWASFVKKTVLGIPS